MSASLVGSEMCIRDSSTARDATQFQLPQTRPRPAKGTKQPAATDRARAVSYTHLTLPTICSV
eukprot:993027-Alexandrium_andersonii.AAC.1